MIDYKFRGQREIDLKWVYGDLETMPQSKQFARIHSYYPNGVYHTQDKVLKDTIGQFTGLKDGNGADIYEGDIILHHNGKHYVIEYDAPEFVYRHNEDGFRSLVNPDLIEVVGNIHDNPYFMERQYQAPIIQNVAELLKDTSYYANKYPDNHATYADLEKRLIGCCDVEGAIIGIDVATGEDRCYGFEVIGFEGEKAVVKYIGLMKS